jgi:hypothetical protein
MFFRSEVKKIVLIILLLSQVMSVQAEEAPKSPAKPVTASEGEGQRYAFNFPRWPTREQANREVIPPAPPGPYMSSALSPFSMTGPSFSRDANQAASRMRSTEMPMKAFSPDIAWPSNLDSPQRWLPESGYTFVNPALRNSSYPVAPPQRSSDFYRQHRGSEVYSRMTQGRMPQKMPSMRPSARTATGVNQGGRPPVTGRAVRSPQSSDIRNSNDNRRYDSGNTARANPYRANPAYAAQRPAYRVPSPPAARP